MFPNQDKVDLRNLILAVVLSTSILIGWQVLVEEPKRQEALHRAEQQKALQQATQQQDTLMPTITEDMRPAIESAEKVPVRKEVIAAAKRVTIDTPDLHGSVNLQGLRIDDATLADYRQTLEEDSEEVVLLSPSSAEAAYFAEFGWLPADKAMAVPNAKTQWQSDSRRLSDNQPLTARWDNGEGLNFTQSIAVKDSFLFEIEQQVHNDTANTVTLYPYGLINRRYKDDKQKFFILHEGPIGVFGEELTEISYEEARDEGKLTYKDNRGWLGITDKYWLTALIPDQTSAFTSNISYIEKDGSGRYQTDYLGKAVTIPPGETVALRTHFFAGAKKVTLLDRYGEMLNVPLFDRAVDFGMLYFLTKPIFMALHYFYGLLGNFGLAIMLLTVCIRLLLFPLANKSFVAMSQMKVMMPKIQELKERYGDDKVKLNQEIMELYKRERINPVSGCFPILLQLPIFFALYKVLFVTIEMRHAPFYGWVEDLSAPDPTNIFTLFGVLNWNPPAFMMIGIWPLLMALTMFIQQQVNPKPTDPVQASILKWLPVIFLFFFASFPVGLVIYWAWNNILSILQQLFITRRHRSLSDE